MKAGTIDNKYRKVLVTAERAKQLLKGARARVDISSIRTTRIALAEVERGLIAFEFASDPPEPEPTEASS
jgi:DNA-directed RNA polymerase subunit K/omega